MDTKKTILSVDDSPINNKLIEAYFRRDYEVISKESGQQALDWLEGNIPDVILLDIMMPVMDGIEVLERIQASDRLKEIPVIMVTAKTEMESIKATLSLGAQDYVKKPIDFTELQTKVLIAFQINEQKQEITKYKSYYDIHQGMIHAQRIQRSILPDAEHFRRLYPKSFIINLPKHVIGGDFYWIQQNFHKNSIGVFDCTGHGVPAAMLTVMGQMELHTLSQNGNEVQADQIFPLLSRKFSRILNTSGDTYTQYDGMDGIFCSIYPQENILEYVGAKRSLVLIRENNTQLIVNNEDTEAKMGNDKYSLFEIAGDRNSIGKESEFVEFTVNKIKFQTGDRIFLYSDGITDQLGGDQQKRLKRKQFFEKLLEIQNKSINLQKSDIFSWLEKWKNSNEQTDDILVVGIEL
ncbi:PP2C family protein-serine/threonine phosphatase [Marinifilum caeruleilacunae]|uniref:Response regulator n=1 Tax=Marinifilum caeruleilacunae TaxID=2499076 RepID=A0ABX1WWS1_9BACT|nr:response regulator [Marinifilum caeruleilacunae]NOU60320.1 response regulator [Marinifilum caeruleilacunae]